MKVLGSIAATFVLLVVLAAAALAQRGQAPVDNNQPRYGADNELMRPDNYREWVYLSSGLGMSYNAAANARGNPNPPFDNVFVTPAAYRSFLQTGTWPDKTMFVLEIRGSSSEGSILTQGRFQQNVVAMEVEVKDESKFPGKWAFFEFGREATSAKPLPTTAACYSCHAENGAVDNTFVQFYPTLSNIAREKGTFKSSAPK